MHPKAIVLGCGMVGTAMVRDLAADSDFSVVAVDVDSKRLERIRSYSHTNVATIQADLSQSDEIARVTQVADVVLGALSSQFGLMVLKTIIEAQKPYVDISFMPEDPLELNGLAQDRGVTVVVDCGVAPGLSNMIVGYVNAQLDTLENVEIFVGGLPKVRHLPFQYKAPFAPIDVIAEYTRPVRLIEGGKIVTKPALTEPEFIDFPQVGTLEAFNTDGLRSLIHTIRANRMVEKTLRYPGHRDAMQMLSQMGFFDTDKINVRGTEIAPRDLTASLVIPRWTYNEGEEEFTVFRTQITGRKGNQTIRYTYDLYDETDRTAGLSSMARTTAYPCTIVARMLAGGKLNQPGVLPPERITTNPEVFTHVISALKQRGVNLSETIETVAH